MGNKIAVHAKAVIKGILFIGFSIQIVLGIVWMCCNFAAVQDFERPDTLLYGGLFALFGEIPQLLYLLQLAVAFIVGTVFLQRLVPVGKAFAIWRGLVLLTFPFAMQCHMALQPHSLFGSLLLLFFYLIIRIVGVGQKNESKRACFSATADRKGRIGRLCMIFVCVVALIAQSGVLGSDEFKAFSRRGIVGNMAHRAAWPTLLNDIDEWTPELLQLAEETWWAAHFSPDNMNLLLDSVEEQVGTQKACEYYGELAKVAWDLHSSMIIRQIGWDVLGYVVTPLVVPLQLAGEAYDSYSGRNYENMRSESPLLTKYYVNYGCWWFAVCLVLSTLLGAIKLFDAVGEKRSFLKGLCREVLLPIGICILLSGVLVGILTLRGAGLMDYKWTIAVNELWLIGALLLMGRVWYREDEMA